MTSISVSGTVLDQFNDERHRIKKLRGKKLTHEQFVVFLLDLSRKVKN